MANQGEEFVRAKPVGARLPKDTLRELSCISFGWASFYVLRTWTLVVVLFAAPLLWPHPALVAACVLGLVAQMHALAIITHEAAHYRLYEQRWLNDLIGCLCGIPLGLSMVTYRVIHRIHHNHLYSTIDPDLALMAGYPRGRLYLCRKLLKDLLGLTVVKNYMYFFGRPGTVKNNGARSSPLDDTSTRLRRGARRDRWMLLIVHLAAIPVLILTGAWQAYLLLWVLPLVTLFQALLRLRALLEHGAVADEAVVERAARTNPAPWYTSWLLFPLHVNYHIEHHLYPSVPHYRLPACHRELVSRGLLVDAEVSPSVRATLGKVFAPAVA